MGGQSSFLAPALAALTCVVLLAGCTGAAHQAAPPSPRPAAASPRPTGPLGSPGNPLLLSCADEAFPGYPGPPVPRRPQPGDLVIGPLFIVSGKRLAAASPAGYGVHGSYKIPFIVLPGATVTVTIGAPVRGQVVIDNPDSPVGGVAAASYHSCAGKTGFFAQGFTFTDGQVRGCVPLEVRVGGQRRVRDVTLSLFAGSCPP